MSTQLSGPKQYKLFAYIGKVENMKDVVLREAARKAIQKQHKEVFALSNTIIPQGRREKNDAVM